MSKGGLCWELGKDRAPLSARTVWIPTSPPWGRHMLPGYRDGWAAFPFGDTLESLTPRHRAGNALEQHGTDGSQNDEQGWLTQHRDVLMKYWCIDEQIPHEGSLSSLWAPTELRCWWNWGRKRIQVLREPKGCKEPHARVLFLTLDQELFRTHCWKSQVGILSFLGLLRGS